MTEAERDKRNLNPHAEAIMAMHVWHDEYAHQGSGSMDFYDKLSEGEKRVCKEGVDQILRAKRA
jgi:hypothetical protein